MGLITDKDEIIKKVKLYFKDNSLMDLTAFIQIECPYTHNHSAFVRDIANKMKRTGEYEILEQENGERFLVYPLPKPSFQQRFWFPIAILSFIIGWFADIAKELYLQKTTQEQIKLKQETPIAPDISHTLNNDTSVAHIVKDTSKKNKIFLPK